MIDSAKNEIILSRHSIPSMAFCQKIINAKSRGVKVYILLSSPYFFQENSNDTISKLYGIHSEIVQYSQSIAKKRSEYITKLTQGGIYPKYIDHRKFFLNHSMYMVIDSNLLYIGSAPNENSDRLDVGFSSNDATIIKTLKHLFDIDYHETKNNINIPNKSGIAIAPNNMRSVLMNVINSAKNSIYMMFPVVTDDPGILSALKNQLDKGVTIKMLCSPEIISIDRESGLNYSLIRHLVNIGVSLRESYSPKIHCRCIITDNNSHDNSHLYIGSGNLKTHSLDYSREVGIVFKNSAFSKKMTQLFDDIWDREKEWNTLYKRQN